MDLNATNQYPSAPTTRYTPSDYPPARHATSSQTACPYGSCPVQPNAAPPHPPPASGPVDPTDTWAVGQGCAAKSQFLGQVNDCVPRQPAVAPRHSESKSHPPSLTSSSYRDPDWPKSSTSSDYYQIPTSDQKMPDFNISLAGSDEEIVDLRNYADYGHDADFSNYIATSGRRYADSYSMSSAGQMPDCSMYEDMSNSEAFAYTPSETSTFSGLEPPSNHLSPLNSPRHHSSGGTSNHSPASSVAQMHGNMQASPYSAVNSSQPNRWSTGVVSTSGSSAPRSIAQNQDGYAAYDQRSNAHHSYPSTSMYYNQSFYANAPTSQYLRPSQQVAATQASAYPSSNQQQSSYQLEVPRPVPSQGQDRISQQPHSHLPVGCSAHFADYADPPDLYACLLETPSDPPESDFHPSDPDMMPKSQELRYEGDLYVPKWVRGSGNKREGWCGFCKPGRWLVLKNSAFWYDKSFTHGVSAQTGAAFQEPKGIRRAEGNLDVWEGLCGSCNEWVALVSSKKKGTTWFRHAYKCHNHPKVRDAPKRRRDPPRHRGPVDSGIDMTEAVGGAGVGHGGSPWASSI